MDELDKGRIEASLPHICEFSLNQVDLLNHLHEEFVFDQNEMEAILRKATKYEVNEAIYTQIQSKGQHAMEKLCKALAETGNQLIVDRIKEVGLELPALAPNTQMSIMQRMRICANFKILISNTNNLVQLGAFLRASGVLSKNDVQEIDACVTSQDKNASMYLKLLDKRPNPFNHLIMALRETNNNHVVNAILEDFESLSELQDSVIGMKPVLVKYSICTKEYIPIKVLQNVWFSVRQCCKSFIGRNQILKDLHSSVMSQEEEWKKQNYKITVLCGIAGVGKSETASAYVSQFHHDNSVVWINGKNAVTIKDSFKRLAANERLTIREDVDLVQEVYRFFGDRNVLFVFDNVDNVGINRDEDGVGRFLPNLSPSMPRHLTLITTQNSEWDTPQHIWDVIKLNPFSKAESIEFVEKWLCLEPACYEDINDLCNLMRGLPLALQQSVEFIKFNQKIHKNVDKYYGIRHFIELFQKETKQPLDYSMYPHVYKDKHPHIDTVYVTWKVVLDGMKLENYGDEAADVLNVIAYMESKALPSRILLGQVKNERRLCLILELLKRYSMITIVDGLISIHDLTQQVVRINAAELRVEKSAIMIGVQLLDRQLPSDIVETFASDWLYPHCICIWEFAKKYPDLLRKHSKLLGATAGHLLIHGNTKRAQSLTDQAAAALPMHPQNPYDPAMQMKIVSLLTSLLRGENEQVLSKYKSLVTIAQGLNARETSAGRGTDADNMAQEFSERLYLFNESSPSVVNATNNLGEAAGTSNRGASSGTNSDPISPAAPLDFLLAAIQSMAGNHSAARNTLQAYAAEFTSSFGSDNILTLMVRLCLAAVYNDQGKNEEALEMIKIIQETERQPKAELDEYSEKPCNDNYIILKRSEIDILISAGNYDEAMDFVNATIQNGTKSGIGDCHLIPLEIDRGIILIRQGKFEEALQVLELAAERSYTELGPQDNTTLSAYTTKVWALDRLKRHSEALQLSLTVYEMTSNKYGRNHQVTQEYLKAVQEIMKEVNNAEVQDID